jgi:hypothetical protein
MTDEKKAEVLDLLNDVDKALGKIRDEVDMFTRKKLSMQIIAVELAICYLEEDKPKEDKKPCELTCTCGDCEYYHPYGVDQYGNGIGECYAQKDAPTVEKNGKPCSMFDWKRESEVEK